MEISSISFGDSGGNSPGSRAASMDLPAPGGPTINRLCPPAAAIATPLTTRTTAAFATPLGSAAAVVVGVVVVLPLLEAESVSSSPSSA